MPSRSFAAGRFAFSIDGEFAGFAKSFAGGNIKGEVAAHDAGPSPFMKKRIATISHEPFTVEVGLGMGKALYSWIESSLEGSRVTRSGEVVSADFDYKARRATSFYDALVSELTIPALDAASKEPAYLTVKIDPERLRHEKRAGEKLQASEAPKTKKWLPSNFRIEIGDLPCERISKIDSFTLKQSIVEDEVGSFREPTKHPAKVEIPNLKVTLSAADAEPWERWFQSFVIDGKCADGDELSGTITFLGPDLEEVLGTVELRHVGIIGLRAADMMAGEEGVPQLEAELYVEGMKFNFVE